MANTSLADLQAMLFELIQSQTKTVMSAEVCPELVLKTIDSAVVPEEKKQAQPRIDLSAGYIFFRDVGRRHCPQTTLRMIRAKGLIRVIWRLPQ